MRADRRLLLACFLALTGTSRADQARIQDADFERVDLKLSPRAPAGAWSIAAHAPGDGRFAIAAGQGRDASRCVRFEKSDAIPQNIHLDQLLSVDTNTVYEISAWIRGDGTTRAALVVCTPDWRRLAAAAAGPSADWQPVRLAFDSRDKPQVRICWHPGLNGDLYRAQAATNFLDNVAIRALDVVPTELRAALDLSCPGDHPAIDPPSVTPGPAGDPAPIRPISCRDGVLVYPDGAEVALWGVNFQTALAWEYNGRLKPAGVPLSADALDRVSETNLAEVRAIGTDVIRLHLCPADFSNAAGDLRPSVYLDVLDRLLARCHRTDTYVYLTLINDMNTRTFPDSFMNARDRTQWLFDPAFAEKTERFIRAFLSRENPSTRLRYADDPAIAVIEVMNEPGYPGWPDIVIDPAFASLRAAFDDWRARRTPDMPPGAAFALWRNATVAAYLDRMVAAIRETGARQPIAWNLNWPAFIRDREDVFQAVAASRVDAVSFCLYPGQQDVPHPFWAHPVDLDGKNYLPFLRDNYLQYDRLRWILGERFARKAKLVYEFETFYTQNSHLYPAMARLFRALGVQIAPMWTYSLTPAAQHLGGSHYLNLLCTPQKAVSFAIASRVFSRTPRHAPYPTAQTDELAFDGCLVSFPRNLSVLQTPDTLMHSRPIADLPAGPPDALRHILACGSSPVVAYDGTGIYRVDLLTNGTADVLIQPDARFTRPHWQRPPRRGTTPEVTCAIDPSATHPFALRLPSFPADSAVFRVSDEGMSPVPRSGPGAAFNASPGRYRIEPGAGARR